MSAVLKNDSMMQGDPTQPSFLRLKPLFQLLGIVVGLPVWGYLAFGSGEAHTWALNSYMYGWIFWLMATLGCLALTLLHGSINCMWTIAVLRVFEAGSSWVMFALLAFFFIPIRLHMGDVYPWVNADANDIVLNFKRAYLNQNGFDLRFLGSMALMGFMSFMMSRSSRRQDKSGNDKERQFRTNFGTPGMVALALIITFFLTDVAMSMTPHWYSTIYPLWLMVGGAQTALTISIIMVCSNAKKQPYAEQMSPALTRDLGNMMFVLTMLWGYTSVSQLIILWNGNLPDTAIFYAVRGADFKLGWNFVGAASVVGCFFIPFSSLLSTRLKRYADRIRNVALIILVFRFVDVYWIIAASSPHREHNFAVPTMWDVIGLVAMGLAWMGAMLTLVAKHPLLPQYDNRLKELKSNAH